MAQSIHRGLRQGTARPPELIRLDDLIESEPTKPKALLLRSMQRVRGELAMAEISTASPIRQWSSSRC
jgi:hypothetical protein